MCINDVSYLHEREIDKFTWIHNMKKGDYLESARHFRRWGVGGEGEGALPTQEKKKAY